VSAVKDALKCGGCLSGSSIACVVCGSVGGARGGGSEEPGMGDGRVPGEAEFSNLIDGIGCGGGNGGKPPSSS
jgi:hypothetical protein